MQQPEIIEHAMREYTDLLFRIAYYYVKDMSLAEDVVQDVFIKFYCSNYEERGELKAYLSRLTANTCKDHLKSWAYKKVQIQQTFSKQAAKREPDKLVRSEELSALDTAILALPLKKREVVVYYYLENISIREIAEIIGRPESTVKSRLKSAREFLKQELAYEEWEVLYDE